MSLTRRQLLLSALLAGPVWGKGVLDWQRQNLLIAAQLESVRGEARLLRLGAGKKLFHSYPAGTPVSLAAGERQQLLAALVKSLRSYSITDGVSRTFLPEFGLQLDSLQLVVSFRSARMLMFGRGRPLTGLLRGGGSAFEQVARQHRLL